MQSSVSVTVSESTGVSLKAVVRGVVCALRLHGTVATGRTNLADIRASNWAGRQEYGTVQAILEHKFLQQVLQVLRKDSATMHREQLACGQFSSGGMHCCEFVHCPTLKSLFIYK